MKSCETCKWCSYWESSDRAKKPNEEYLGCDKQNGKWIEDCQVCENYEQEKPIRKGE